MAEHKVVHENGSTTTKVHLKYGYDDYSNRTDRQDELYPGSQIAAYSYDGLNRRIRKLVTNSGALDTDLHCYYDGPMPERPGWRWRCVEDRAVDTSQWTEALRAQYLWGGQYLDELVAFEVDVSNGSGGAPDGDFDDTDDTNAVVWHDALYSAVAVLSAKTDHLGELLERYEYDPYGKATIFGKSTSADAACTAPLGHSAVKLPFLFAGQRLDEEAGLTYYKRRYYDAAMGRFVARDPLEYVDGVNLHLLARANPVNLTDPTGLVGPLVAVAGGGVVVIKAGGAAITVATAICCLVPSCRQALAEAISKTLQTVEEELEETVETVREALEETTTAPKPDPDPPPIPLVDPNLLPTTDDEDCPRCLPCDPPVGTKGYRVDTTGDAHYPYGLPHVHLKVIRQRPAHAGDKPCLCEWVKDVPDGMPGDQPPPGRLDVNAHPAGGGGFAPMRV